MKLTLVAVLVGLLCAVVEAAPRNWSTAAHRVASSERPYLTSGLTDRAGTRLAEEGRGPQDCVRGAPVPILASTGGSAEQSFEKLGENEAREKATFDDGVELTVHQFGCEHYAVDFTFEWKGEKVTARSAQGWLKRAAELLQRVNVTTTQEKAVRSMVETLRRNAGRRYALGRPLKMSEMETLTLTVENVNERIKLNLLYDVAL